MHRDPKEDGEVPSKMAEILCKKNVESEYIRSSQNICELGRSGSKIVLYLNRISPDENIQYCLEFPI
jgi:hypothetical protein